METIVEWNVCSRAGGGVHGCVYVFHRHLAVNLLHGFPGILHGDKGLLIDICRLDGIDLLLQHGYLAVRLLEGVLMLLLAF